jgi:hypothetical protein
MNSETNVYYRSKQMSKYTDDNWNQIFFTTSMYRKKARINPVVLN